ncbi:MAG: hypothetical protein ACETWT_07340 [Thermodesulfobacteriota bacterium]
MTKSLKAICAFLYIEHMIRARVILVETLLSFETGLAVPREFENRTTLALTSMRKKIIVNLSGGEEDILAKAWISSLISLAAHKGA